MSRPASSAALPIAYVALRILIVVNWLSGVAIAALLVAMPTRQWIMSALDVSPGPEADQLIMGLRAIALIGLAAIPVNDVVLKRLLAIVETVRAGDPFVAANASRLRAIAWALLALQLLSLVIGAIAKTVSTPAHLLDIDAGFSINDWLAVICTVRSGRRRPFSTRNTIALWTRSLRIDSRVTTRTLRPSLFMPRPQARYQD